MQTNGVSGVTNTSGLQSVTPADQMKSEDFFKLLVTELQQQDPLEPAKTSDMVGQVSQIRNIELSQQLISTLGQMTLQQRTAGASELLGKYVEAATVGADGSATTTSGIVTGVRFNTDGTAVLELDSGQLVSAADVTRVATSADAAAAATDSSKETAAGKSKAAANSKTQTQAKNPVGQWLEKALHI